MTSFQFFPMFEELERIRKKVGWDIWGKSFVEKWGVICKVGFAFRLICRNFAAKLNDDEKSHRCRFGQVA